MCVSRYDNVNQLNRTHQGTPVAKVVKQKKKRVATRRIPDSDPISGKPTSPALVLDAEDGIEEGEPNEQPTPPPNSHTNASSLPSVCPYFGCDDPFPSSPSSELIELVNSEGALGGRIRRLEICIQIQKEYNAVEDTRKINAE